MKVCVTDKLTLSESKRELLCKSFEYHRACIRHLVYLHVLANARISGPVSVKNRPSKIIFSMDTDTNVYVAVC